MRKPRCPLCHRQRPAAPCPSCGQDQGDEVERRHRAAKRMRSAIRAFWAQDTESLMLVETFEQAATGQGLEDFPAALKGAMQEAIASWGVPSVPG